MITKTADSDQERLTQHFRSHLAHCFQCASGSLCPIGDAMLTGIGLASPRGKQSEKPE